MRFSNQHNQPRSKVQVYVEADSELLVPALERILNENHIRLDLIDSPVKEQSLPLFIVCKSNLTAASTIEKFSLTNPLIYWLPGTTFDGSNEQPAIGHWLSNWQQPKQLQAILSLFNHSATISTKLAHADKKLSLLSGFLGEYTVTLDANGLIVDAGPEISQLLAQPLQKLYGQPWQKVVKIPSPAARARINAIIDSANTIHSATRISTFPIQCAEQIMMMDGFVGPTSEQSIVLILREVASWPVHEWHAQQSNEPVSLLLINPDNLSDINHHYSREQGDEALAEVLQTISGILRDNDFATRYSGAVFAAQLPDTNAKQAQQLTSRLHQLLAGKQYTQHKLSLSFSIGVATIEGQEQIDEQSPLELFRRANTALQAARNIGGGKLVTWRPQFDSNVIANLDRMSGKFSSEPNDDFRVMMLQWDVIRLLGQNHTLQTFAQQSSKLLQSGLKSDYLDFYLLKQGQLTNISANNVNPLTDHSLDSLESWASRQLQLQLKSTARLKSESTVIEQQVCTFIPLMIRQQCEAIILAKWPEKLTPTAKKRAAQLLQLAPNFAATLDRILLLEQEQKRPSLTQQAQGETHQLIFESAAMRTLIQQVQLVGPTDATVLIIGESGTGKELIAQQIHNQSLRPEKPFITVDCSTIVEHLIESELFGHKRGAFTGANNDKLGRIAQADGGTLFLDEVGELPLEIQSKLLRFVQEKTYVAVGDQRVKKVDVRLVLATNRNLAEEVNKGRFRGDLYYRINVFTLHLPDLEQRGTDKLLLARHFISKYAAQYGKSIRDLSTKAEAKIMDYSWPGNVRELQNNIMRSVIVCPGNTIEAEHIVLQHQPQITDKIDSTHIQTVPASPSPFVDLPGILQEWAKLAVNQAHPEPIALLFEKHLVEQCLKKWDSLYKVSQKLKMPESTLRRRYQKANEAVFSPSLSEDLQNRLNHQLALTIQNEPAPGLWTRLESLLVEVVLASTANQQIRASLLNVSQPTLRKLIGQLESSAAS